MNCLPLELLDYLANLCYPLDAMMLKYSCKTFYYAINPIYKGNAYKIGDVFRLVKDDKICKLAKYGHLDLIKHCDNMVDLMVTICQYDGDYADLRPMFDYFASRFDGPLNEFRDIAMINGRVKLYKHIYNGDKSGRKYYYDLAITAMKSENIVLMEKYLSYYSKFIYGNTGNDVVISVMNYIWGNKMQIINRYIEHTGIHSIKMRDFYRLCMAKAVNISVPDWYMLMEAAASGDIIIFKKILEIYTEEATFIDAKILTKWALTTGNLDIEVLLADEGLLFDLDRLYAYSVVGNLDGIKSIDIDGLIDLTFDAYGVNDDDGSAEVVGVSVSFAIDHEHKDCVLYLIQFGSHIHSKTIDYCFKHNIIEILQYMVARCYEMPEKIYGNIEMAEIFIGEGYCSRRDILAAAIGSGDLYTIKHFITPEYHGMLEVYRYKGTARLVKKHLSIV